MIVAVRYESTINCPQLLLKSSKWRVHCYNESESTIDNESEARHGDDNSQRHKAKWQDTTGVRLRC